MVVAAFVSGVIAWLQIPVPPLTYYVLGAILDLREAQRNSSFLSLPQEAGGFCCLQGTQHSVWSSQRSQQVFAVCTAVVFINIIVGVVMMANP